MTSGMSQRRLDLSAMGLMGGGRGGDPLAGGAEEELVGRGAFDFDFDFAGHAVVEFDAEGGGGEDVEFDAGAAVAFFGGDFGDAGFDGSEFSPGEAFQSQAGRGSLAEAAVGGLGREEGDDAELAGGDDGGDVGAFAEHAAVAEDGGFADGAGDGGTDEAAFDIVGDAAEGGVGVGATAFEVGDFGTDGGDADGALAFAGLLFVLEAGDGGAGGGDGAFVLFEIGEGAFVIAVCGEAFAFEAFEAAAFEFGLFGGGFGFTDAESRLFDGRLGGVLFLDAGGFFGGDLGFEGFNFREDGGGAGGFFVGAEFFGEGVEADEDIAGGDVLAEGEIGTDDAAGEGGLDDGSGGGDFEAGVGGGFVENYGDAEHPIGDGGEEGEAGGEFPEGGGGAGTLNFVERFGESGGEHGRAGDRPL